MQFRRPDRGFTLIELLVTLAVAAVLAAIAIPNFTEMVRARRAEATANAFTADLNYARMEGIRRARTVSICPAAALGASTPPSACSGQTDWSNGWLIFSDPDANGSVNVAAGEEILRIRTPERGLAITANGNMATVTSISARPNGQLSTDGNLQSCAGSRGVRTILMRSGSIRMEGNITCP